MGSLPLHPAIVHLPLGLAAVLPLLALIALVGWVTLRLSRSSWWLVALLQAFVFVGALAAERTGEADEELVEERVPHDAIHEHEERAETFVALSGGLMVLTLAAALVRREGIARGLAALSVLGLGVNVGLGMWVGEAGGALVYQHDAGGAHAARAGDAGAPMDRLRGEGDEDDEDDEDDD